MENGISIYAGLGYKQKENIELIKFAAKSGMKRLFTSTQIFKIYLRCIISILTSSRDWTHIFLLIKTKCYTISE